MNIVKSYITDESGKIKSVIIDYQTYQKIEKLLLDEGLLKAMEEVQDEETTEYEEIISPPDEKERKQKIDNAVENIFRRRRSAYQRLAEGV